jgi:hypothetical protein
MKLQTTKKQIKANFSKIISIPYCDAQYLLNFKKPFAFSAGVYGWACDYYEIGHVCISTGYSPIGTQIDYKALQALENEASNVCYSNLSFEQKSKKIDLLIEKLINL